MFEKITSFVRKYYNEPDKFISLHEPRFIGNERAYVLDTIDSTFVSSVGKYVDRFEEMIRDYTGSKYAIATTNGTTALHISLMVAGVRRGDLVITQSLTFVATCNAISYVGADPIFVDVALDSLGLSSAHLELFLKEKTIIREGECFHKETGRRISACVPMHTFGHPTKIDEIASLCEQYKVALIEDAAESLGSKFKGKECGTFGLLGTFSFNGNKTITSGGGGMVVTNNEKIGKLVKHLTTQAKVPHPWHFVHDHIGYNYRLPNLNAALACAQMEQLDKFITAKRDLASAYKDFFSGSGIRFVEEPEGSTSNYWLNAVLFNSVSERDEFLEYSNSMGVMARPAWTLMHNLSMFTACHKASDLSNSVFIADRLVNLPSSVRI